MRLTDHEPRGSLSPPRAPSGSIAICTLASVTVLSACLDSSTTPTGPDATTALAPTVAASGQLRGRHEPGRILVSFRSGADPASIAEAHGAVLTREFIPGGWIATVPDGSELAVAAALARNPKVVFAEPDFVRLLGDPVCPGCAPSDQFFEWQWALHNDGDVDLGSGLVFQTAQVDADIDWLEAYEHLGPSPAGAVKIGVLDTGIRATHEDFCGKSVIWMNFYQPEDPSPLDDHGHGTHVSGTAGACADNFALGVAGVAYGPDMDFVVGKVCAFDGTCLSSAIAEAIYWAVDQGADVINMSFGDTSPSGAEAQALAYAASMNVLPVCAAGNDGVRSVLYPAADPNCVAVSATDYGDERSSYSSYGPEVELAAPGGDLEDPVLGTSFIISTWGGADNDYVLTIGTSMAAPHVTGLAALLHTLGVTNASDKRACLRSTADDLGASGWDEQFGWGRINMYQAVLQAESCASGGGGGPGGNIPPVAVVTKDCDGHSCSFDGSESWDADGEIASYGWSFGDGATATGPTATHDYAGPGSYTVTLTVLDEEGASGSSSVEVSVGVMHVGDLEVWSERDKGNRWRAYLDVTVADVGGSPVSGATVDVALTGAASGTASASTGADGVATLSSDGIRGDGVVTFTVTGLSHPVVAYDPALDTDADGDSDGRTATVGPPNALPNAAFVDDCLALVCTFNDASSDPDGTIVSWQWDFGDGATSTEQSPTHTYLVSLFYFVTLTVTDDQGATATEARLVFVPPVDVGLVLTGAVTKERGSKQIDLSWEGGSGDVVDLYRDGVIIAREYAPRSYTDVLGRGSGSYTYQVCESFTNACSNELTLTY